MRVIQSKITQNFQQELRLSCAGPGSAFADFQHSSSWKVNPSYLSSEDFIHKPATRISTFSSQTTPISSQRIWLLVTRVLMMLLKSEIPIHSSSS